MNDRYNSPLSERYASKEMQYIFSPDMKFKTWRKLWIALAESEMELGLNITQEQIDELKEHAEDINYDVAKEREKIVRHDVMSHVYAYGVQCPKAKGIIHLGATSCYVGDNTDIIVMTEALKLVRKKLINVINELAKFADKYKSQPTLAFTHFQPAQPTTVGKRATLWLMELKLDLDDLDYVLDGMMLLGSKGTTGTQASFLELFEGDHEKIKELEKKIAKKMGIPVRVAHAHSAPCGRNMKMIMRLYFRRKLQKYCTHKVACGEKAAKWLFGSDADLVEMESFVKGEKHSKNTVVLMKNAVDTDKFSYSTDVREKVRKKMKISRDTLVIGHVGRFTHDKNQSFLIDIFKNVNILNKKSAMMLIGGGKPKEEISYKEEIERKVQQSGLKGKVKLLGVREDINELMQAMDILVMPSRTEGFPVTLVEAQAVGLCCLVSDAVGYDINMTEKIQYKSLEEDASQWAQKILSMTADGQNREAESILMKEKVIERGYEIADAAKDLEAFYEYLAG